MVYASKVNGKRLTFCVSGKLWNRSLVMMDVETQSLWSHILGEAMEGKLKGTTLKSIPSDMVTWERWKELHPQTTVLNLPPTRFSRYTKDFYAQNPSQFVFGLILHGQAYHSSWATLKKAPLQQIGGPQEAVILADPKSTVVRAFERRLDGKLLEFRLDSEGQIRDASTQSRWNRQGIASSGPLKGKKLTPIAGLMSFTKAWKTFHPGSKPVPQANP